MRKTEQNRPKFRKTLVSFAHVSIPTQPVPIPDRVQWALSIPLIISFLDPLTSDKAQNIVKKRTEPPKIQKHAGPIRTCVDSNSTSADSRSSSMSSIDSTNYFFLDPPHPRQSPKYREKNEQNAQNWEKRWSHSHMCRFQLNQCRFQIEFNELYRFH